MRNLFQYVGLRHLKMKPIRTILTTVGVSFGITLFVAIGIINRSTLDSFKESIEAVAGKAKLSVTAGESGFTEDKIEIVAKVPGVKNAVPMVESRAYFAGARDTSETLFVLGVDLLKEQSVRTYKTSDQEVIDDPLTFLNQPDSIIVTRAFAEQHGFKLDDRFTLATAHGNRTFTVRGLLSPEGPAKAYGGAVAIMDIDGARETFGKQNKLDRIDVVPRDNVDVDELSQKISTALGAGFLVERPQTQSEHMEKLIKSYQTMLTFFSTLALLVGLFLVTNSVTIAVAERRREIGSLRALGATRFSILALFLSEAVVMGALGAFAGAWMGRGLASVLVKMVTRSMSSQYLTRIEVNHLVFGTSDVTRAVAIGASAACIAALIPAYQASTIEPLEAMRRREIGEEASQRGLFRYAPWIGAGLLAFMALVTTTGLSTQYKWLDTVGQVCSMIGSALLGPAIVAALVRAFKPVVLKSGDAVSRLAQDNLLRNPRRTGSNVMSLTIGLILVIMIAAVHVSFRKTVIAWFDRILHADFVISSSGNVLAYQSQPLHEDMGKDLIAIPGVMKGEGASGLRFVHLQYEGRQLGLKAYDPPSDGKYPFDVLDRSPQEAGHELFHSDQLVLFASNSFTLHFNKKTGDTIALDTPSGRKAFKIIATIADFANPEGVFYIDRKIYRELWHDKLVNLFGIKLEPGVDRESVRKEIDRKFGKSKSLVVTSFAELREALFSSIDQGFEYLHAIEIAALLVGLLGLLNTLLISVMERMRELGMLRAVGMSRAQLTRMILQEALLQGGFGAIAAVILGGGVTYLWVKHSLSHILGWVVEFHFPWGSAGMTVLVGTFVALLAGVFPAWRASRLEIRDALEYE